MFSARQGVFDLNLFTLTAAPLNFDLSTQTLSKIRWRDERLLKNVRVTDAEMSEFLREVRKNTKIAPAENAWHLNVLACRKVNRDAEILTWKEDLFFATGGPGAKIHERAARIDVGRPLPYFARESSSSSGG